VWLTHFARIPGTTIISIAFSNFQQVCINSSLNLPVFDQYELATFILQRHWKMNLQSDFTFIFSHPFLSASAIPSMTHSVNLTLSSDKTCLCSIARSATLLSIVGETWSWPETDNPFTILNISILSALFLYARDHNLNRLSLSSYGNFFRSGNMLVKRCSF